MRAVVMTFTGFAALSACAPQASDMPEAPTIPDPADIPQSIQDIDFTSYSRDLAQPLGLDITEGQKTAKSKIQSYFKPEKGAEGRAEYNFIELGGLGASVTIASASGLADDSIKAQEFFAVFKDNMLVDYGMKIKCWRSDMPDQWQTELCA